jgi:hypothetical protein
MTPTELEETITATRTEKEVADQHETEQAILNALGDKTVAASSLRRLGVKGSQKTIDAALNSLVSHYMCVVRGSGVSDIGSAVTIPRCALASL